MSGRIIQHENKVKKVESKLSELNEIKDSAKLVEHKEVSNKVEESKNVTNKNDKIKKKSQLKQRNNSVFKFGPEACATEVKKENPLRVEKIPKVLNWEIYEYR